MFKIFSEHRLFRYFLTLYTLAAVMSTQCKNEHIILIIADDMGWNDCSIHGSRQFPTPEIDALATYGILFSRHYSENLCTPSRAALNTGMMPYKIGMQGNPITAGSASALPIKFRLLPQYFKELGYRCHLVGKWHLGSHKKCYLPTNRGWDTYYGSLHGFTGHHDNTHFLQKGFYGGDTYRNEKEAFSECNGEYVTERLTNETITVIKNHSTKEPLLMMLTHNGPHANNRGAGIMLRTPNGWGRQTNHIENERRQAYADAVREVDISLSRILEALHETDMLKCSTIVFFSDNGGPTVDLKFNLGNEASNWPLKGLKMSPFEGGIRTIATMWTHRNPEPKMYKCLFHITDWLPTLYEAAGGNVTDLGKIDGVSHWTQLISNSEDEECVRDRCFTEIIEDSYSYIQGKMKIVKTFNESSKKAFTNGYWGDTGRTDSPWSYSDIATLALNGRIGQLLNNYSLHTYDQLKTIYNKKRADASLDNQCRNRIESNGENYANCTITSCLFDLNSDPCEMTDLSSEYPTIYAEMTEALEEEMKLVVPKIDAEIDARSAPRCWGNMWTTWLDPEPLVNYTCFGPLPGVNESETCENDFPQFTWHN